MALYKLNPLSAELILIYGFVFAQKDAKDFVWMNLGIISPIIHIIAFIIKIIIEHRLSVNRITWSNPISFTHPPFTPSSPPQN